MNNSEVFLLIYAPNVTIMSHDIHLGHCGKSKSYAVTVKSQRKKYLSFRVVALSLEELDSGYCNRF